VTEIGQELGVEHVLEGSVRKAGNSIRINAQLIETRTGGHVWAERYDSDVQDIFALQDEITGKITAALQVNLVKSPGIERGTHSVKAYELNLKGRAKFFMFSPETNRESITHFERALVADPEYSDAWAGQVFPYQSGWSFAWPGYDDGLIIAAGKARKAVELAPHSSLAQCRMGWVQTFLRQPEASVESFERAIGIDPNNADTHIWFSEALNYAGQPERAVKVGETALRFDPVAPPNALHHIAHGYFLSGNLDKAEEFERRAIRMAPSFPPARLVMSAIMVASGRLGEAKEQMADLLAIDSDYNFKGYEERYPYHNPEHRERMACAVKAAGLR
jgi:Tfp pilus assembly protein PilF